MFQACFTVDNSVLPFETEPHHQPHDATALRKTEKKLQPPLPPQAKQTCPNCGGTSELYNALHKSKLLLSNPGMHALFQDLKEAAKKLSTACNSQPCSLQRIRLTLEFQRAMMMESVHQHSCLYRYCSRRGSDREDKKRKKLHRHLLSLQDWHSTTWKCKSKSDRRRTALLCRTNRVRA